MRKEKKEQSYKIRSIKKPKCIVDFFEISCYDMRRMKIKGSGYMAEDARIRKTKQKLSSALVALLQEKAFSDISPAQVCERAGVNRSTFYRNYRNLTQLKTEMENRILSGIRWKGESSEATRIRENILSQLAFLRENRDLFLALSTSDTRDNIFEKVRSRAIQVARDAYNRVPDAPSREVYDNLCVFYISAVLGVVSDWFMAGMVQSNESLADFLTPWMVSASEQIGI